MGIKSSHPFRQGHNSLKNSNYTVLLYALIVFMSSALLMVLEIAAGRLIAPYVGVSLYTWTAIIGVILGGLSVGNWLGGIWADRGATAAHAGLVLMLTGFSCLSIFYLLTLVAGALQQQETSLLVASFIYVASLFLIPSILIGIITPLLTTISLKLNPNTGHIVGMMNALAASGSIAGTFLCGYWLLQFYGTFTTLMGTAVCFFILALPLIVLKNLKYVTLIITASILVVFLAELNDGTRSPCDTESQYYCIRVVDMEIGTTEGNAKAMILDHLLHGINHQQKPELLIAPYVQGMDVLLHYGLASRISHGQYFFAGGGSYTHPRAMKARYPDSRLIVAEIDTRVTEAAEQLMQLDPAGMNIIHHDARIVLQRWQGERFDAIIGDVFHDIAIPYHLTTREYARLLKSRLKTDGIYVINIVDIFPDPLLVKSVYKTLQAEFTHTDIWLEEIPQVKGRLTYILSATNGKAFPEKVDALSGLQRTWTKQNELVLHQHTPMDKLTVLTDDFVPIEKLLSELIATRHGL